MSFVPSESELNSTPCYSRCSRPEGRIEELVDTGVQQGISYRYEVTSVDKSGNESKPISTPWVLVPRTP